MRLQDRVIAPRKIAQRAVIDIGSNTVRLVFYDGPVRAPEVFLNEKVTARLGRGLGETGVLSEKSMAAALAGLNRFATLLWLQGVKDVQIAATAAVRDAANGVVVRGDVRDLCSVPFASPFLPGASLMMAILSPECEFSAQNNKSRIRPGCGFINHETSSPSLPYAGITQVRL